MNPQTETELAAVIANAAGPLAIMGGGTRGVTQPGEGLTVSGLSGIELYEPGSLTLVAGAGTPLAEIEAVLAEENQRLAFEPMDHRGLLGTSGQPTVGGVVAANVSGPRRVQVGACRDHLLGLRFVDGRGSIVSNGGRVMKNVTGYDLVKLFGGSWGTLGVLSQVSLKVLPQTETQATLLINVEDPTAAVRTMSAALGSPFEVTGAAYGNGVVGSMPVVMIRIEGFEASVAYRCGELAVVLATFGEVELIDDAGKSEAVWASVRDVEPFHSLSGDVWRISVKPSDAPILAARTDADGLLFDWGGGLIWARVPEGTDLRSRLGAFSGHATLVRSNEKTRRDFGMFQPEPAPLAAISAGLRTRFDPRSIFNPGLMQTPAKD